MATQAIASFGTFLQLGDGAGNYSTVAEVGDITFDLKTRIKELLSHSSGQPWVNRIATILDAGPVKFPISLVPADPTHSLGAGLLSVYTNRQSASWKLLFNSDAGSIFWLFTGPIESLSLNAPVEGVYNSSVSIAVDGQPTLA
jgi:hypothetical protein